MDVDWNSWSLAGANIMVRGNYFERVIWGKKQARKQLLMMNVSEGFSDHNVLLHCLFAALEKYS